MNLELSFPVFEMHQAKGRAWKDPSYSPKHLGIQTSWQLVLTRAHGSTLRIRASHRYQDWAPSGKSVQKSQDGIAQALIAAVHTINLTSQP